MGKHFKRKNKKIVVLSILQMIFLVALIVSITYIINWLYNNKQNEKLEEKISETVVVENEDNIDVKYNIDFRELKEINNQVVGWIKVNETEIEYPVVQANDNNYYLKRNLEKNYNVGGWIFADYKNNFDGADKNIVIYGHNRKDGSMFGTLKNILKEEWYSKEENLVINFITEQEQSKYQVFSVYKIKKEDYYINTEFKENEFSEFINTLKNRSVKDFEIEVTENDSILTLSTCADNNKFRIVLHAKKITD